MPGLSSVRNEGKGGAWSFKDDRGRTAEAASTPERIVAYVSSAAALHDFGIDCTGVFGPTKLENGEPDVQAGSLDVDKVTVIGNAWGEFSIEKYASLRPELLVSNMNVAPVLSYVPEESAQKIQSLAPSVGILTGGTSLLTAIERYAALAGSLGADLGAGKVTSAKSRFETASESLRTAARDRGGVRVLAASAQPDLLYAGVPDDFVDLRYCQKPGVDFVTPDSPDNGGFWKSLSWENADTYPADLIMVDKRTGNLQPAQLSGSDPTWRDLPAVRAGQVIPWENEARHSYAGYAPLMESLATALRDAKEVRG